MKKELYYHKPALEWIKKLSRPLTGRLNKSGSMLMDVSARFRKVGNHHEISFSAGPFSEKLQGLNVGQTHKKVAFDTGKLNLVFEELYLRNHSGSTLICDANFFYTKGFSKKSKYFHRLIIPLTRDLYFRFHIKQHGFATDLGYRSAVGTKAIINKDELLIHVIHDNNEQYFISIHSRRKQSHELFSNKVFAVLCSLGYLTGHMPGDKAYYFSYTNQSMQKPDHCYVRSVRNTIVSSYFPVHTNPFAWSTPRKLSEKIYNEKMLQPISIEVFSALCQKAFNSEDVSSVLLLILESSVASLLFMPGGYAIALESLADIIAGNDKQQLAPIKEKHLSKRVRCALQTVLQSFADQIGTEGTNVLKGKIDQINQVTNKSRLKVPFDALHIELSEKDLKVLGSRNDFLHGRIPDITSAGADRPTQRKNLDLFYSAMHFYTLLNILILKWVGFNDYILNHPQIYARFAKVNLQEYPYRKL